MESINSAFFGESIVIIICTHDLLITQPNTQISMHNPISAYCTLTVGNSKNYTEQFHWNLSYPGSLVYTTVRTSEIFEIHANNGAEVIGLNENDVMIAISLYVSI